MHQQRQRDDIIGVEATAQTEIGSLLEEITGQQRDPKGDHTKPHQSCEHACLCWSQATDDVMRMNHLEITVQCHSGHERHAGRSVDRQHVEVNAAPGGSKSPVVPPPVGIDAEGHADEEQEVSQDQVQKENDVGFPDLQKSTRPVEFLEDPRESRSSRRLGGRRFLPGAGQVPLRFKSISTEPSRVLVSLKL